MDRIGLPGSHAMAHAALAGLAMVLAAPGGARAEDTGPEIELAPIVVEDGGVTDTSAGPVLGWRALTGSGVTRTGTPVEEIPQSVTILPRSLIEDQGARSVSEALRNAAGVVPVLDGEIFLQPALVRGFETVQYYDGLPAFSLTNSFDSGTAINVERIEVIKGPSGALFGGGIGAPLGGVINVVPVRPLDRTRYAGFVSGGSFGTFGVGGDVNFVVGGEGGVRLRTTAEYRRADSFIDLIDGEQFAVFPTLEVDIGEDTLLRISGQWSARDFVEFPGFPAGALGFAFDETQYPGPSATPRSSSRTAAATVQLEHRSEPGLTGHFSVRYTSDEFAEIDGFASGFGDPDPTDTVFPVYNGFLNNDVSGLNVNAWGVAEFATGPVSHTLLFGAEYDRTSVDTVLDFNFGVGLLDLANPVDLPFGPLGSGTGGTFYEQEFQTFAVYLQDEATLFDRLHLLGSVRLSSVTVEDQNVTFGAVTEVDETALTVRGGVVFDVTDAFSLFAGYGQGYQVPLYFIPAVPGTPVRPQTSEQIEAGLRFDFGGTLSGSLAAFQITQQEVPRAAGFGTSVQVGEERSRGAEVEVLWQPTPAFSLLAQYAFVDAVVTEDIGGTAGDRLREVPRHSGRVAARYSFREGPLGGLSLGLGLTAASGAEVTEPNTVRTDAYVTVDAHAAYDFGPATIRLDVENLLGEDYFLPYGFLDNTVVPGQPRTFLVTLQAEL